MATATAERCGRYELRHVLGEGGMGTVYRAWDPELARNVAIKIVHGWPSDDSYFERFRIEAQLLARLPHPHIVSIYDIGSIAGEPFIVMELVEGKSLAGLLAAGPVVPFEDKLRAAVQVCGALSFAHAQGVIHRDVKPANILLTEQGIAKLADFGIARLQGISLTQPSQVVGSPAYLAPEVFDGRPADARTDIYGLAACLYEWLSGARPHDVEDLRVLAARVSRDEPRPLSDIWLDCPPSLERCVHKGLARDLDARYQTADELASDLRAILGEASPAAGVASSEHPSSFRLPWRRLVLGVCAMAALTSGGLLWIGRGQSADAPPAISGAAPAAAAGVDAAAPAPSEPADASIRTGGAPPTSGGAPPTRGGAPAISRPERVRDAEEQTDEDPVPASLPIGTPLRAQIVTELRTDRNVVGHEFEAALSDPIEWRGQRIADAGTRMKGLVHDVGAGGRDAQAFIQLSLTTMVLPGGDVPIRTARYRVVAPPAADGSSLRVLILGTALGALSGAAVGGADGAVKGGALGAALSSAPTEAPASVVLTAPLTFKLAAPMPLPLKVP